MLKILSPFKEKEEIIPLIEAGADELYCGYLAPEWVSRYTSLEFERKGGHSNFTDLKALKKAVNLAHKENTPVFLTLNGLYVHAQYPLLMKIIEQLKGIELDGYIVADLGLVLTLREKGYKGQIHISTGGTVFNSEAARFYRELGASRIVLDRQTSFDSMGVLAAANPDIDFEVFVLYTLCVHIDGFCTFLHTYGRETREIIPRTYCQGAEQIHLTTVIDMDAQGDACCLKYSVRTLKAKSNKQIKGIQPTFFKHLSDGVECGACAIYDINQTRVKTLKIVGRQLDAEARLKGTEFIRHVLELLRKDQNITKKDFINQAQALYQKAYNLKGKCQGNNCYHPEAILFKK
jgi:U32 family peptidase